MSISQPPMETSEDEELIEILPLVNLLLRNLGWIAKSTALLILAVGLTTLFMQPTYTATVKFLPSDTGAQSRNVSNMPSFGQIDSSMTNLPEYYQALLQSSALLEATAKRHIINHIEKAEKAESNQNELLEILSKSKVTANKSSANARIQILELAVNSDDSNLSVELANELIDELSSYSASQRNYASRTTRDFIEKRAQEAEASLRSAENALAEFSLSNRNIDMPDLQVEKDRLKRAINIQEESYKNLRKQLDLQNIKVLEEVNMLQVLERPDRATKSGPKRTRILLLTSAIGLLFFSLYVVLKDRWAKLDQQDPEINELLVNLDSIHDQIELFCQKHLPGLLRLVTATTGFLVQAAKFVQTRLANWRV